MFNFSGRMDPMTGKTPQLIVLSNFRKLYCIIRLYTVDRNCSLPLLFALGEESHGIATVVSFVVNSLAAGWIGRGDTIMMDNARVISGGSADILHDLLWNSPGFDGSPLNAVLMS